MATYTIDRFGCNSHRYLGTRHVEADTIDEALRHTARWARSLRPRTQAFRITVPGRADTVMVYADNDHSFPLQPVVTLYLHDRNGKIQTINYQAS